MKITQYKQIFCRISKKMFKVYFFILFLKVYVGVVDYQHLCKGQVDQQRLFKGQVDYKRLCKGQVDHQRLCKGQFDHQRLCKGQASFLSFFSSASSPSRVLESLRRFFPIMRQGFGGGRGSIPSTL